MKTSLARRRSTTLRGASTRARVKTETFEAEGEIQAPSPAGVICIATGVSALVVGGMIVYFELEKRREREKARLRQEEQERENAEWIRRMNALNEHARVVAEAQTQALVAAQFSRVQWNTPASLRRDRTVEWLPPGR